MHGVSNAVLLLPDLDFGGAADPDDGDAAGQPGKPLLQLVAVEVDVVFLDGRVLLELQPDLAYPGIDVGLLAGAADDRGVLLVDRHLSGAAEEVERQVLELQAERVRDHRSAGQQRDVLHNRLAQLSIGGRLHSGHLEAAA